MAFLSTKGIIHRDLKSQNVLLASRMWTSDWRGGDDEPIWAKVADFGIAKAHGHTLMTTAGATQKLLADKAHQRTWPPNFSEDYPTREWTRNAMRIHTA